MKPAWALGYELLRSSPLRTTMSDYRGVRYFELERKAPYWDGYMGGYWLTPWMGLAFLLMAALDGASGWRYRRRHRYYRHWTPERGYYMRRET